MFTKNNTILGVGGGERSMIFALFCFLAKTAFPQSYFISYHFFERARTCAGVGGTKSRAERES